MKQTLGNTEWTAVHLLACELASNVSPEKIAEITYKHLFDIFRPDVLVLFRSEGDALLLQGEAPASAIFQKRPADFRRIVQHLCGAAADNKKPSFFCDIHEDAHFPGKECKKAGLGSFAAIPLIVEDDIAGVMGIGAYRYHNLSRHSLFLHTIGVHIGIALKRDRLHADNGVVSDAGLGNATELKLAQDENRRRKQFLESVLSHAPDAIVTLDREHRVADWNPGAVRMFGYTAEEAFGKNLDDLLSRDHFRKEANDITRIVLSGQRVEAFETIRFRKDGTSLNVMAAGSPIIIDDNLIGAVAVYTDLTVQKRSEERFRALVEESPLGISLIGSDGRYKYVNPRFKELFGYTIQDIPTGAEWFKKAYPSPAYRREVIKAWIDDRHQIDIGQARPRVFTVTCKDGPNKKIHFRPVTMENLDQFIIYEDITEKSKMERQLRQVQKYEAIGTLAGGVAHDFNNLLMGIQGRTSLMSVELPPSHPHKEHIEAIEEYIRSAADLTKQMLGLARGGKYEVKPCDLGDLILGSSTMFGRTRKEIRIHTKMHAFPLVVEVDRGQIEQVLLNVYVNAWQAMPKGGEIFLETMIVALEDAFCKAHQIQPGQYAKLSVTDTGIGMDEATRRRIFDPFFTTKEKGRGTGLGLASAYGIIKNHGGVITVYSEIGLGSTFNIYLPLSDKAVSRNAPMDAGLINGAETILVIDDEQMILDVSRALLEKLGYHVIAAQSGAEAVEIVTDLGKKINLVILDLIMPGMDGARTFDRIRKIQPDMPVLLASGYAINSQADEIMRRGCNGFIQKPFNVSELSKNVRKILDN